MSNQKNEIPFKQIFIGNVTLKSMIYERKEKDLNNNFSNDINKIFVKICNSGSYQTGQRNKLKASDDFLFYFNLCTNNIFYLIVTTSAFAEYDIYRFIDFIHGKEIYTNINLENKLNQKGCDLIEESINEFQKNSSSQLINDINKDILEVKNDMKNNLREVLKSTDDARSLEDQSNNIKLGALEYEQNSKELKKATCWQNFKWTIILCSVIIIVVGIVLIAIFS